MNKKSALFLIIVFFSFAGLFGQTRKVIEQNLDMQNASWNVVIGGKALCKPQNTSYGFAVLTDGKMISAISNNGVKLWEHPVPGKPDPILTVFSSDFLLSVNDKRNLSLINPSGLTLWTKKLPFEITNSPSSGRDSRIFVKGKKNIACYGLNGVCKWVIDTQPLRDLPVYEMNDGSLLAFLEQTPNGRSSGIRFTPFGEIIETINFAGLVKNACTLPQKGILLVFTGNGAGLCSVNDGQTITKWAIPSEDKAFSECISNSGCEFLVLNNSKSVLVINAGTKTRVITFNNSDGRVSDYFNVPANYSNLSCSSVTKDGQGIFLSDNTKAYVYTPSGILNWCGLLPKGNKNTAWNYVSYTHSNHVIVCSNAWIVNGYRTSQSLSKKTSAFQNNKKLDYSDYYNVDTSYFESFNFNGKIDSEYLGKNRIETLRSGNYGKQEIKIASDLLSLSKAYTNHLTMSNSGARPDFKSVFETDASGIQEFLNQISLMGTDDYSKILATLIKNEPKDDNLKTLIIAAGTCGYDPQGLMLSAIDFRMTEINAKNTGILNSMCDSVYEICRYMGRPALFEHGIAILTRMMYPQFSSSTKDKARQTLLKISKLRI